MATNTLNTINRLENLFQIKNKNVLNVYFTAGYPRLDSTIEVMSALQKNGADLIEVGMPYSDPVADGQVIQQSNMAALQNGMNIKLLFEQLENMRAQIDIPVILMGYLNPILQYGADKFFEKAAEIGVDGVILPELPFIEYEREYEAYMKKYNLDFIFLITPETSDERIRKIDAQSKGFIYAVSSSSITGNNKAIEDQTGYFKRLQQMQLKTPILVGFGIKDKNSFQTACRHTNGAIIGSAYIKALENADNIDKVTRQFMDSILH